MIKIRKKGFQVLEVTKDYCCIDIETTGLKNGVDRIIEFAGIKVRNGEIVDSFTTMIRPNIYVSEFITDLTGITNEMLMEEPSMEEIGMEIYRFLEHEVILGHNVNFDINFLFDELYDAFGIELTNDYIDTMYLSRRIVKNIENHKLDTLIKYYNIPKRGLHRALGDCQLTKIVYEHLCNEMENQNITIK